MLYCIVLHSIANVYVCPFSRMWCRRLPMACILLRSLRVHPALNHLLPFWYKRIHDVVCETAERFLLVFPGYAYSYAACLGPTVISSLPSVLVRDVSVTYHLLYL